MGGRYCFAKNSGEYTLFPEGMFEFRGCTDPEGYKIVGRARILETGDEGFDEAFDKLCLYRRKFPIPSVIEISVELVADQSS